MIAVIFCQRLRELRMKSNFKQEYVALCLGISQPAYCRLEKGMVDGVSLRMVDAIARLYNVMPSYFFLNDEENHHISTNKMVFSAANNRQSPVSTLTPHSVFNQLNIVLGSTCFWVNLNAPDAIFMMSYC